MSGFVMSQVMSQVTIRDCVCSICWGHLLRWPEPGTRDGWIVKCHRCQDRTRGFVTKYYAETRRSDSIAEKWEVRSMLEDMGIIDKQPSRPVGQILSELGF